MSKMMKREGPDPVEPVTIGDIRFEAVHWGDDIGASQDGGYIVAIDKNNNEQLWTLMIYETLYDNDRERDVQDVFITKLAVIGDNGTLAVENEHGDRFIVDIQTRTVSDA